MKHLLTTLAFVLVLSLSACSSYIQVLHPKPVSSGIRVDHSLYVFENDSLMIVYLFWDQKGTMSFLIRNKLDIPLYIDWKKSSEILDSRVISYYSEQSVSSYRAIDASYDDALGSLGFAAGSAVTTKLERVTFLPPHAHIERRFYRLTDYDYTRLKDVQPYTEKVNGLTTERVLLGSPVLSFRNFITYSTTESFASEQHISNDFAVRDISMVKNSDFLRYDKHQGRLVSTMYDQCSFYLKPTPKGTIYR
ncbi:MAG: hypothetical protein BGO69_11295 [Bacteroidetes bacterium 46-16]|nr:MAG: hypothetical protein BGO69_11295 [Bacteroidetes bacterium 46-16]